jgi:hypothetical protein
VEKLAPFGKLRDRDFFAAGIVARLVPFPVAEPAEAWVEKLAPFGKLRDRDFFTVSELAELPLMSGTYKYLQYACICPEGAKCDSPGQRPGKMAQ